ncbi:MAG: hypothetical protein O2854_01745 [Chloroflexi bacterium]|nr:hypothetical protein [Chloroflexota bacterium]
MKTSIGVLVLGGALLAGIACAPVAAQEPETQNPTPVVQFAPLSDADEATIIRLALGWALVDKNVPDYVILDDKNFVVSLDGIDNILAPKLPGVNFIALNPKEVQDLADKNGNFGYLNIRDLRTNGGMVEVAVETRMAVAQDSDILYLIGGGAVLQFEQVDGEWQITGQGASWIS